MTKKTMPPVHPGEVLHELFLEPMSMSAAQLARSLHVPGNRITRILAGQTRITGDTALRLARFYGNSAQFWLNLQSRYDLQVAEDAGIPEIQPLDAV